MRETHDGNRGGHRQYNRVVAQAVELHTSQSLSTHATLEDCQYAAEPYDHGSVLPLPMFGR